MRKVILFNLVTLDGFFEGPNREIGWHNVDEEFNEFTGDQLNTFDIRIISINRGKSETRTLPSIAQNG